MKWSFGLVGIVASMLAGPRAGAAVDQEYVPPSIGFVCGIGVFDAVDWAQTFTVGSTGTLTGFDVAISRRPGITEPLLYDIRTTTPAGQPTENDSGQNVLVSGAFPAAMVPFETDSLTTPSILPHIELQSPGLPVVAGEIFAIALRSESPGDEEGKAYLWQANGELDRVPGYDGGVAYLRNIAGWTGNPFDEIFRTYVTPVPEPSAVISLALFVPLVSLTRSMQKLSRNEQHG